MGGKTTPAPRTAIGIAIIVIFLVAAFAIYSGITYPHAILTVPVSFTIGTDVSNTQFSQFALKSMAQVKVSIQSGLALWRARILAGDTIVWEHTAAQGEQQSYYGGWIPLAPGNYNFTFGIIGGNSLQATATVSSKGGFW